MIAIIPSIAVAAVIDVVLANDVQRHLDARREAIEDALADLVRQSEVLVALGLRPRSELLLGHDVLVLGSIDLPPQQLSGGDIIDREPGTTMDAALSNLDLITETHLVFCCCVWGSEGVSEGVRLCVCVCV